MPLRRTPYPDIEPARVVSFFIHAGCKLVLRLATVAQQLPKLIGQFMLEKNSVDDVGLIDDRVRKAALHVTNELGRHTNGALSFDAPAPEFDFEIGPKNYLVSDAWARAVPIGP